MAKHREHKDRKIIKKILIGVLSLVVLLVVSAGGFYLYAKNDIESRIQTEDLIEDYSRPEVPPVAKKALNILVIGSDTRAGGNGKGVGGETPSLSDTTMLLHISKNRDFAYGVSIPRDSMVNRPSCPRKDGAGSAPEEFGMFNAAYAIGGAACTLKTVETLTGVRINHFMVIDFNGFREIIDAIGGVSICVPEEVNDPIGDIYLKAGRYNMDGDTALKYVRVRHGLGAELGDIGRMKRQQSFVSSVLAKVLSQNILADPIQSYGLATTMAENSTMDKEFADLEKMLALGQSLRGVGMNQIKFFTVPFEAYPEDPNRLIWSEEAGVVWEALRNDVKLTPAMLKDNDSISPKRKNRKNSGKNLGPVDNINGICS